MTVLTASQLLGATAGRPAGAEPLGAWLRGLARRLAAARARRRLPPLGALPAHVLRDVGLDGADLRGL